MTQKITPNFNNVVSLNTKVNSTNIQKTSSSLERTPDSDTYEKKASTKNKKTLMTLVGLCAAAIVTCSVFIKRKNIKPLQPDKISNIEPPSIPTLSEEEKVLLTLKEKVKNAFDALISKQDASIEELQKFDRTHLDAKQIETLDALIGSKQQEIIQQQAQQAQKTVLNQKVLSEQSTPSVVQQSQPQLKPTIDHEKLKRQQEELEKLAQVQAQKVQQIAQQVDELQRIAMEKQAAIAEALAKQQAKMGLS